MSFKSMVPKQAQLKKAIIAEDLLCLKNQDMQSITEPSGQRSHLRFKLNIVMNIQEKYVGKDLLQIPRQMGDDPPTVLFCKILGVRNEKPEEPPTTVIIGQLEREQTYLICNLWHPLSKWFYNQKKSSLVKMNQ